MPGPSAFIRQQCPNATVANDGLMTKEQAQLVAAGGSSEFTSTSLKTTTYTAVAQDRVLCDAAGGDFTVNLPAAPAANARVQVINCGASGIVTVKTTDGASIVTIVGATGWQLDAPSSAIFIFVNSQWSIE